MSPANLNINDKWQIKNKAESLTRFGFYREQKAIAKRWDVFSYMQLYKKKPNNCA